jgi:hypothetical protein
VYIGGSYVGNGFALGADAISDASLSQRLSSANARMECSRNCDALAPAHERAELHSMIQSPLAMLGWAGCPCTGIARDRFESVGACYVQRVWVSAPSGSSPRESPLAPLARVLLTT